MSFTSFIKGMSSDCGWNKVEVHSDTLVSLPFTTDAGPLRVFIRPCGRTDGKTVIEFSSAGVPVPEKDAAEHAMLRFLMERNGNLMHAHWGIEDTSDGPKFTVFKNQIAETMDTPEFQSSVRGVLDEFERFLAALKKMARKSEIDF